MAEKTTRILIVDGSTVSREILSRILQSEITQVKVDNCKSGADAVRKLDKNHYDLITTALMLPDMDGLALCRNIRNSHTHKHTPVIVVSGDADERLLQEGFKAGVTDYFDKSNGYKAFGNFIKSFIQRNSSLVGHVLFIEDSKTAAAVICDILERHGLKVTHADSAELALELLEKQRYDENTEDPIDLVITDFYLQGDLTGGDLLYAIRTRFHYSQQELPVLVITGNDDQKTQVEVFHAGGNDFVTKPILEEVIIARIRLLLLIRHQFEALKQQAESIRWIAATDSLTGVRSKRYLVDNGEEFIQNTANQPVWAVIIDLDNFKDINNSLGHITGDHILAELGSKLNQSFPEDMVVRFGGEEFSILMKNQSLKEALQKTEKLRKEIEKLKPANVELTVSIGLASMQDHPDSTLTQILALADKALFQSKDTGRNRVSVNLPEGIKLSILHNN
ncbi:MAG: response regulator [Gammaproteobacteria bacterium]|nr:response regulator [Gammaproteobacteria bacterium]